MTLRSSYHSFFCSREVHEFMPPIQLTPGLNTLRCKHCLKATLMTDRQLWLRNLWPRAVGFAMIPSGPALAAFLMFRFDLSLSNTIAVDTIAAALLFVGSALLFAGPGE